MINECRNRKSNENSSSHTNEITNATKNDKQKLLSPIHKQNERVECLLNRRRNKKNNKNSIVFDKSTITDDDQEDLINNNNINDNGNENIDNDDDDNINNDVDKKSDTIKKDINNRISNNKVLNKNLNNNNNNSNNIINNNDNNELNRKYNNNNNNNNDDKFIFYIEFDLMTYILFIIAFCTRIYRLSEPNNVVFDELHYGKYVSLYMKNTFFFDQHPPLGKQFIAAIAYMAGYNGNYTFSKIGTQYTENVPVFTLRFIPALCGSLLAPFVYKLLLQIKLNKWTATLGGLLIIFDNALLTQSRFILMESMLLSSSVLALIFLLKFHESKTFTLAWVVYAIFAAISYTITISIKFVGIYSFALGAIISLHYLWQILPHEQFKISNLKLYFQIIFRLCVFTIVPITVYLLIFQQHLNVLHKAGPHDSIMTSAFQASLEGGLASITKGQPINIVHGSQITLRHTLGRPCWLHSHTHVYPVRYADNRGSSHQQQVTCYSFKDVNNWWIVKRPERTDLVVGDILDPIKHDDVVQLVHGITSRALNSHDVAAAMSPQCQEISCYIDYNVSMPAQILWKVDIINREQAGDFWHAIKSHVRLIHNTTGQAMRFSGRQLPEWGFNQHEVVADRIIEQSDTIWNVEEHRYTKTDDQKERERQLLNAEMIPTNPTKLSYWEKFIELQNKMLWYNEKLQSHMYCSEPLDWPFMNKGIAYWVAKDSNAQIHLLGNILIWYSGTIGLFLYVILLTIYLIRRRRQCFDLTALEWQRFTQAGQLFLFGYLIHYLPYFFVERTLFLHNYFPALIFKILLLCYLIEHIQVIIIRILGKSTKSIRILTYSYLLFVTIWLFCIIYIFYKFSVLSYGTTKLTANDVINLRWKDTWDFILHKDIP